MSPRVWFDNIALGLSQNLRLQGRLVDAENAARSAILTALRSHGRNSGHTAAVIDNLVAILLEQGRSEDAGVLARAVVDIFDQAKVPPASLARSAARARVGDAFALQGRWVEALAEYESASAALEGNPAAHDQLTNGNVNWALALIFSGQPESVNALLQGQFDRRVRQVGTIDYVAAEMQGIIALAASSAGDRMTALEKFHSALPVLISGAAQGGEQAGSSSASSQRLAHILEGYIDLLLSIRGTDLESVAGVDIVAETFRIADVARNSSVQRALAQSAARSATRDRNLSELTRRMQDAEKRLVSAARALTIVLSRPETETDPALVANLQQQIEETRNDRDKFSLELARSFPAYADLIKPPPATIGDVRRQLHDGEALLATFVGAHRSFAWAVSKNTKAMAIAIDSNHAELTILTAELRQSLEPGATTISEIPAFDLVAAQNLYGTFLKPLEAAWQSSASLIVVPHGPLAAR